MAYIHLLLLSCRSTSKTECGCHRIFLHWVYFRVCFLAGPVSNLYCDFSLWYVSFLFLLYLFVCLFIYTYSTSCWLPFCKFYSCRLYYNVIIIILLLLLCGCNNLTEFHYWERPCRICPFCFIQGNNLIAFGFTIFCQLSNKV